MKKKKTLLTAVVAAIVVGGVSFGIVQQQNAKAERITQQKKKEVKKDEKKDKKDPYKNLSKVKAEKVTNLDDEVAKLVGQKKAIKPLDNLKNAEAALKELDSKDADLKSVHDAYASVINTVKTPELDTLQDARTAIANMDDTKISDHMADEFEDKLIDIVAVDKKTDKKQVAEATKPLTPQQAQAKKDKKAQEAKDAEAKAKADAEREKKEHAANDAAQKAEADKQVANNQGNGNATQDNGHVAPPAEETYTPPADNGGGNYTPPANNGGGNYTPPANNGGGTQTPPATNNGGGASNNNAAQDAANNVKPPKPPVTNQDNSTITGNGAPNGWEPAPGGW